MIHMHSHGPGKTRVYHSYMATHYLNWSLKVKAEGEGLNVKKSVTCPAAVYRQKIRTFSFKILNVMRKSTSFRFRYFIISLLYKVKMWLGIRHVECILILRTWLFSVVMVSFFGHFLVHSFSHVTSEMGWKRMTKSQLQCSIARFLPNFFSAKRQHF